MLLNNDFSAHVTGQVFAHKLSFITIALSQYGIDLPSLLKGTGIDQQALNNSEYKIHKTQIITFYRNVLALNIPGTSVLLGKSIKPKDYGLYGCTLLCSNELKSALEFAIRYHDLVTKTVNMSLHLESDKRQALFRFEDVLFENDLTEFNIEMQCVIVLSLVRECLGCEPFAFDALRFSFNKPKHYQMLEDYFRCPISYSNSHNEFVIAEEKLYLQAPKSNPFAMPLLLNQCDRVLKSVAIKNQLLITINQWVISNMHKELCAENLANDLYLTPRTLRRKLAEQGTSFTRIVKELRCSAAKKLITETHLTIEDIGCSIGFHDVSNFRTAFKKWTGKTPSTLRQVS